MGFIADVRLSSPDLMLAGTLRAVPSVEVETTYHAAATPATPYLFYVARGDDLESFEAVLEDDPSVRAVTCVERLESERVYRVALSEAPLLVVPALVDVGAAFLRGQGSGDGWLVRAWLPDRDALVAFKSFCERNDVAFDLRQLYRSTTATGDGAYGLTAAQREALVTAYEHGYFEEPRRTSLNELGDALNVSSTAVGGRIRRGTAALLETTLLEGAEGT
ncbi:helix-turn-helix domain-containing protein [Natrononativus amylolyticus]|uniref:helix-turn-helix domain-containing protein n=1 Tax=Natrononativus amylolyticus TaxID=2963434 RepID=UPI0020CC0C91|nr:helix-turn-helix domain-containing protein [Natrononativus amylolyticus]